MLRRFHHARGLKVCVWINPYIAQKAFQAISRRSGQRLLYQANRWLNLADRPLAAGHGHRRLHQPRKPASGSPATLPNSSIWAWTLSRPDFGERIPIEGVVFHDGSDPVKMHNFYSITTIMRLFSGRSKKDGALASPCSSRALHMPRGSVFPFTGEAIAGALLSRWPSRFAAACRSALCGFGFWSHDIGGFEGTAGRLRIINAGRPSACSLRTAACTAT